MDQVGKAATSGGMKKILGVILILAINIGRNCPDCEDSEKR